MISEFKLGQQNEISTLVKKVFDDFVGHEYSKEGNDVFYEFITPENILKRFNDGNLILTYRKDEKIAGMIEIRDNNHVCLFFTDSSLHKKGIGKKLLEAAVNEINDKTDFFEVNASPFSEKIYVKLGFVKTGELTEANGIKYVPMKMEVI